MNAIEFVKSIGVERVSELVNECPENMHYIGKCGFSKTHWNEFACKNDLKQIVEAFELVKKHGGLNNAKYDAQYLFADWDYRAPMERRLKQAIELVEKCNANQD